MLIAVYAEPPDEAEFEVVRFKPNGLNLIVAECTEHAGNNASRNSLGKTTLLHIIDFCLGSNPKKDGELPTGWTFSLELMLNGISYRFERLMDEPKFVWVNGDITGWQLEGGVQPDLIQNRFRLTVEQLRQNLGLMLFDLPVIFPEESPQRASGVSYRGLVKPFMRTSVERPLVYDPRMPESTSRVLVAYLLNLDFANIGQQAMLKTRREKETSVKNVIEEDLKSRNENVTQLRQRRDEEKQRLDELKRAVEAFDLSGVADNVAQSVEKLSRMIHAFESRLIADGRQLDRTNSALEQGIAASEVIDLFHEAETELGANVRHRLDEVERFHANLNRHRKALLLEEKMTLEKDIQRLKKALPRLQEKFTQKVEVLRQNELAAQHVAQQQLLLQQQRTYDEIDGQLRMYDETVLRIDAIDNETKDCVAAAAEAFANDEAGLADVKRTYAALSRLVYGCTGELKIEYSHHQPKKGTYSIEPTIAISTSDGKKHLIQAMMDLSIALGQRAREHAMDFIIHDTPNFDAPDPRQVGNYLREAHRLALAGNIQYICMFNSNTLRNAELQEGFPLSDSSALTVLHLCDDTPAHLLLHRIF